MVEEQPTAQCPHCGYPAEIGEHAPDCQNKPSQETIRNVNEQSDISNELESSKSSEVFETLEPQNITDAEGVERKIYNFTSSTGREVKVLFYSPDELPYSDEMVKDRQGLIIGNPPPSRSTEEWMKFQEQIRKNSKDDFSSTDPSSVIGSEARTAGAASFFVESSPQAILDMAFYLGVEDDKLREMRRVLAKGETNDEIEKFMDQIIAGKVIDKEGKMQSERNEEGEALVLMALQGNKGAQQELEKRSQSLSQYDVALKDELDADVAGMAVHSEEVYADVEQLNIDSLVAVHTTGYRPKKHGSGYSMESTFDGSKGDMLRNTVHFSMNHHVTSHMSGNWDHSPYVVLSPFSKMIEANGKPANINTVDTYFEQNPNQPVILPEGTFLVGPGAVESGELFKIEKDGSVKYTKDSIDLKDIAAIIDRLDAEKLFGIESSLITSIENSIRHNIKIDDESLDKDYEERYAVSYKVRDLLQQAWETNEWQAVLFEQFKEKGIEQAINDLIDSAGIGEVLHAAERRQVIEAVHNAIRSDIKQMAVEATITHMGYENHSGGMWAWDKDSFDATAATTKLAHDMGIQTGAHSNTPEANLTEDYYRSLSQFKSGDVTLKEYRDRSEKINAKHLDEVSPKTRRMMYMRGVL
ncbi:hypothetical protein IID19_03790 [Patescibacteria group bacterium]|nr:hypothetical protein [Patescibacteria group bacterium]